MDTIPHFTEARRGDGPSEGRGWDLNPCICDSTLAPAFRLEGGSLAPVPNPTESPGKARLPAAPSPTPPSGGEGLAGRQVVGGVHELHGSDLCVTSLGDDLRRADISVPQCLPPQRGSQVR